MVEGASNLLGKTVIDYNTGDESNYSGSDEEDK